MNIGKDFGTKEQVGQPFSYKRAKANSRFQHLEAFEYWDIPVSPGLKVGETHLDSVLNVLAEIPVSKPIKFWLMKLDPIDAMRVAERLSSFRSEVRHRFEVLSASEPEYESLREFREYGIEVKVEKRLKKSWFSRIFGL